MKKDKRQWETLPATGLLLLGLAMTQCNVTFFNHGGWLGPPVRDITFFQSWRSVGASRLEFR